MRRSKLAACPGFVGAEGEHRVVIEPAYITEAVKWLKRRFYVSENLDLSDNGLCVDLTPRVRSCKIGAARRRVTFAKPVQFELAL